MWRAFSSPRRVSVSAFLSRALRHEGHEVTVVPDGSAALTALAGGH